PEAGASPSPGRRAGRLGPPRQKDFIMTTDNVATIARPQRRTNVRFGVLALIALGTMINYLDRSLLAVAAPSMSADLGLGAAAMGIVFSAFSWSYALAQIPGGMILDRIG